MTGSRYDQALEITDKLFWHDNKMRPDTVANKAVRHLGTVEDGDVFAEYRVAQAFTLTDGVLTNDSLQMSAGFSVRAINAQARGLAHSAQFSHKRLDEAFKDATAQVYDTQASGKHDLDAVHGRRQHTLYRADNPLDSVPDSEKIRLLQNIDAYVREQNANVTQVNATLSMAWQAIQIIRTDGTRLADIRPMVKLGIMPVLNNKFEGIGSMGGRFDVSRILDESTWQSVCDNALEQAGYLSQARDIEGGEMPVVLNNGWCGVLIHEAVGHALEADSVRTGGSVYKDYFGEKVASDLVTIVDDGAIDETRGALNLDDEGTPTGKNVLIRNGYIERFMNDRQSARLMDAQPTGNGRRESYQDHVLTRMTSTYMAAGNDNPQDMIRDIEHGIYADSFGGGSVNTPTGAFNFESNLAWRIENGRLVEPVKGAVLTGDVRSALQGVTMVGNDCALDDGGGTCGKNGQGAPVNVGQPSVRIERGIKVSGAGGPA